jgi:hypothetical protein
VTPAEVAAELSTSDRFRFMGLPAGSAASDAARKLFDHGRGEEAFTRWIHVGTGGLPEEVLISLDEA